MPPPAGYLNVAGIDACVNYLASTFPALCQLVTLPEQTIEGRPIRAFRLRAGSGSRNGLLMVGGHHARETINPDLLVRLAIHLCWAYTNGTGLTYGGKSWSATDIRLVLDGTELFIVPQVNPDGRAHVFRPDPDGDRWWRKNRSYNLRTPCRGTDLNRNYDFLWRWTIGSTSADPCDLQYRGDAVFSEPETRNVRWLLRTFPTINAFVDVHSFSELLLYPWGDDNNQSSDPSQTFRNPQWDGMRGIKYSGYAEYIPSADQARFVDIGTRVRSAIAAVRGRTYTLEQGADLYPTSGVSSDYAYSRYFRGRNTKVWAWGIETNTKDRGDAYGFQPGYEDAVVVMDEVSSGLIQLALSTVCLVHEVGTSFMTPVKEASLRAFRDGAMRGTVNGERWISLLDAHGEEVLALIGRDAKLRETAEAALKAATEVVLSEDRAKVLESGDAEPMRRLLKAIGSRGSRVLARAAARLSRDLERSIGKTATQAVGRKRREERRLATVEVPEQSDAAPRDRPVEDESV